MMYSEVADGLLLVLCLILIMEAVECTVMYSSTYNSLKALEKKSFTILEDVVTRKAWLVFCLSLPEYLSKAVVEDTLAPVE